MSTEPTPAHAPSAAARSFIAVIDREEPARREKAMPIDLTDAEIERIRLEEKCRLVIREELTETSTRAGARLWKFLNSAFALWLLSAVALWTAGATYARWSEARAAERQRIATCEALDLEIGYRLSHALASLYQMQQTHDEGLSAGTRSLSEISPDQKQRTTKVVQRLHRAPDGGVPPLYPEYATFGLPALISELCRNERDPARRQELTTVLRNVTADSTDDSIELTPAGWAERITDRYVLARWTNDFEVNEPFR